MDAGPCPSSIAIIGHFHAPVTWEEVLTSYENATVIEVMLKYTSEDLLRVF